MAGVSVVIPTCNGRTFIGDALRSVFAQTRLPDEVIVVDDASSDGTPEVATEAARQSPMPVRLIRLERNSGGPAHPLNVGIAAAAQELIAVLDQDDTLLPTKLERQVPLLAQHRELAFVFSLCGLQDSPEQAALSPAEMEALGRESVEADGYRRIKGRGALRLLLEYGNFVWGYPGFVFRRRDWERKGGLDTDLRIASDYDLLCWLCTQGGVGFVPEVQYVRREHGANLSGQHAAMEREVARVRARYRRRHPVRSLLRRLRLLAR